MVNIVLDASAVLRYLDKEAGSDRVAEAFQEHTSGRAHVLIFALHWGEVIGRTFKRNGQPSVDQIRHTLESSTSKSLSLLPNSVREATLIHVTKKIPYVDSFAVELCKTFASALLITADFHFKPAEQDIEIEFLPTKPKP